MTDKKLISKIFNYKQLMQFNIKKKNKKQKTNQKMGIRPK